MSYSGSTSMLGIADPAINQNEKRDVGSEIRYLAYGMASLSALIEGLILDSKTGEIKKTGGLIKKDTVENMRYENFSRPARPMRYTVTSGTEITSSGVVLTHVNGLSVRQSLYNPRNKTACRVEVISTLTVTGASVGATTFSCQAGDELEAGPCPIPEGSGTSIVMNGNDDHSFNILEYIRSGISISDLAKAMTPLAGGDRFARERKYLLNEFIARIDRAMIFGKKTTNSATLNYTAGAQTGFTTEKFFTTDGLIAIAGNSWDMNGAFTLETLQTTLPQNMGDVINENDPMIALCSNEFYGKLQTEIRKSGMHYNTEKEGILDKFGIKTTKLVTDGPELTFMKHSAMNNAGAKNQLVIFAPSNVSYCHLKDHDIKPRTSIQDNKTLGQEDELVACFGMRTYDAGQTITYVTNCY